VKGGDASAGVRDPAGRDFVSRTILLAQEASDLMTKFVDMCASTAHERVKTRYAVFAWKH
jgi:hypothetical protein